MVSIRSSILCLVWVFLLLAACGLQSVHASAWTDYVDNAEAIFAKDNQRLNTRLVPTERSAIKVLVEVRQTGAIKEIKVLESSGNDRLDTATVASIEALTSLPTPPASVYFRQFFTPLIFVYNFDPAAIPVSVPAPTVAVPIASDADQITEDEDLLRDNPDPVVADLQTALITAGYDPGPVDGYFGPGTANAIRDFQRDNDLTVDGVPTVALIAVIKNQSGRATLEPVQSAVDTSVPDGKQREPVESGFTPPETGKFSLNREIFEDYDYIDNRQLEDYESVD